MNWEWLEGHEVLLYWLGALSLISFLAGILIIPILVARMDSRYFVRDVSFRTSAKRGLGHWIKRVGKNALGGVLLFAGFVMLFVPGQGVLTMLIGLTLVDFLGKTKLQRKLVQIKPVQRSLNWMRLRKGREKLIFP